MSRSLIAPTSNLIILYSTKTQSINCLNSHSPLINCHGRARLGHKRETSEATRLQTKWCLDWSWEASAKTGGLWGRERNAKHERGARPLTGSASRKISACGNPIVYALTPPWNDRHGRMSRRTKQFNLLALKMSQIPNLQMFTWRKIVNRLSLIKLSHVVQNEQRYKPKHRAQETKNSNKFRMH